MQRINAYAIPAEHKFELEIPPTAEILSVDAKGGIPRMWILYDTNAILIWRTFVLIPSESSIVYPIEKMNFIGSFPTTTQRIFVFEDIQIH